VLWLNASNVRAIPAGQDRYVLAVDVDDAIGVRLANRTGGPDAFAETYEARRNSSVVYRTFDDSGAPPTLSVRYSVQWFANDSAGRAAAETNRTVALAPATIGLDLPDAVDAGANATLSGWTTLPNGTTVEVAARAGDHTVARDTATVRNGTVNVTLDLSDVDAPTTVAIGASAPEAPSLTVTVRDTDVLSAAHRRPAVPLPVGTPSASVQVENETTGGDVRATATLSHGGVLVLRADGETLAVSEPLPANERATVTFDLDDQLEDDELTVVAWRYDPAFTTRWFDGDRYPNGTTTVRVDADGASTTGTSESGERTTETTRTTSTTTTTTVTSTGRLSTTTESPSTLVGSDRGPTTSPIPGFGALPVLAALAALAVVRTRRR